MALEEKVEFTLFLDIQSKEMNAISYEIPSIHKIKPVKSSFLCYRGAWQKFLHRLSSQLCHCKAMAWFHFKILWGSSMKLSNNSVKCNFLNFWHDLRVNFKLLIRKVGLHVLQEMLHDLASFTCSLWPLPTVPILVYRENDNVCQHKLMLGGSP